MKKYRVEYAIEADWPDALEEIVEAESEFDAAQEIRIKLRSRDIDIFSVREIE